MNSEMRIVPRERLVDIISATLRSAKPGLRMGLFNGQGDKRIEAARAIAAQVVDALDFAEINAEPNAEANSFGHFINSSDRRP